MAAILAGCTSEPTAPPAAYDRPHRAEVSPNFDGAPELPPPDMSDTGPGSLIDVKPVTGMAAFDDANATAVRVSFKSTSGRDGAPSLVTGVVVVPPGQPPKGGWPVVAFGHAMTGVQPKCGPTLAQDYWGYASAIVSLLGRGFVVAFPDFEGLGIEGALHSAVDATTLGNNMIDAARAARRYCPPPARGGRLTGSARAVWVRGRRRSGPEPTVPECISSAPWRCRRMRTWLRWSTPPSRAPSAVPGSRGTTSGSCRAWPTWIPSSTSTSTAPE